MLPTFSRRVDIVILTGGAVWAYNGGQMVDVAVVLGAMGQPSSPSQKISAQESAREVVRRGFPASVIEKLARMYDTSVREIQEKIGLSPTTAKRRRGQKALLSLIHSDRALRLGTALTFARYVFEDDENAAEWFKEPNRALGGSRPFDLLDTEIGTQQVMRILGRIEHGVYS